MTPRNIHEKSHFFCKMFAAAFQGIIWVAEVVSKLCKLKPHDAQQWKNNALHSQSRFGRFTLLVQARLSIRATGFYRGKEQRLTPTVQPCASKITVAAKQSRIKRRKRTLLWGSVDRRHVYKNEGWLSIAERRWLAKIYSWMFATPAQITTRLARKTPGSTQWRSQVKVLGVANRLTLSEQRYFVWGTAPQSTERQDVLEIWETWPLPSPSVVKVSWSSK